MEAKYKKAAEFKASIESAFIGGRVDAHWIKNTSRFWYKKESAKESFSFIIVDAETGKSEDAFDHEALQSALGKQDIKASADKFQFQELKIDSDLKTIKFYLEDKLWQFERETSKLSECDMDDEANHADIVEVEPLEKEIRSGIDKAEVKCWFTFLNKRSKAIKVWWVDYEGDTQPRMFKTAEPGKSCRWSTYNGHTWRVCDAETGDLIACYKTPYQESAFVTINAKTKPRPKKDSSPDDDALPRCILKNFKVFLKEKDKADVQLSASGSEDFPFDPDCVDHSDDGKYACLWQSTPEQKRKTYRIESTPQDQLHPRLVEGEDLKPGDAALIERPKLFDLVQKSEIPISDVLFSNPYRMEIIGWSSDSQKYRFVYNERGHKVMRVVELDIRGNTRTLVEERYSTFIDWSEKVDFRYEKDTDELIWLSERDGTNHLYLIKLNKTTGSTGHSKALQLTHGARNVYCIERIDSKKRQIYFEMYGAVPGQDPYYKYPARVDMDGTNFTILATENGTHRWTWSPDFKYFVDEWSRVDKPPQTNLRDSNGTLIHTMLEANISDLLSLGWTPPERFAAPGRDGITPIYGIIINPPTFFTPKSRYPVIENIYAGPHGFFVPKPFGHHSKLYALATLGFTVVIIDGMGTNWRSRHFHDTCYKNLKDAGLPDRIAWLKHAARTRPHMDLTRVGIYGTSAGGQNALAALLWHGHFYKAAIADCGCHDNRLDKLWWNEQWMGWPIDESYAANSNVVHAHRLQGNLMLIVGEMDSNVDPASTLQVANALNKEGKDYELVFVPGGRHGCGESTKYLFRRQWDFWVRWLLDEKTPRWNCDDVKERVGGCYNE